MAQTNLRPHFSIIVPCYNDGALAVGAVRSCLAQTTKADVEVILVDDGSTDGSAALVECAFPGERSLIVLRKSNGGLASARNHGVRNARGEWLVFLDSDDLLAPDFLRCADGVLSGAPWRVNMIAMPFRYVPSDGRRDVRVWLNGLLLAPRFTLGTCWNRFWIRVGNPWPVSSIVLAADFARQVGEFDVSLRAHEDWDYWIRAVDRGACICYAPAHPLAVTVISVRQGMSANRGLMARTHHEVRSRYCLHMPFALLNVRFIAWFLLGLRTVLGLGLELIGRRSNLTLP